MIKAARSAAYGTAGGQEAVRRRSGGGQVNGRRSGAEDPGRLEVEREGEDGGLATPVITRVASVTRLDALFPKHPCPRGESNSHPKPARSRPKSTGSDSGYVKSKRRRHGSIVRDQRMTGTRLVCVQRDLCTTCAKCA